MEPAVDSYALLTHAAHVTCSPTALTALARAAQRFQAWDELPARAEHHGLAPLLYSYLRRAEVDVPHPAVRQLQALTIRHRHASRVRTAVLGEIVPALRNAGIDVLVLKGGALAHILYPRPDLRPMRDLDLLVKQVDVARVQATLATMSGYAPERHPDGEHAAHHVTAAVVREGVRVSVETHYTLHGLQLDDIQRRIDFQLHPDGPTAQTLGYEETMWYLCRHAVGHTNVFESIRLIWVADVVGFAEQFADRIDWDRVRDRFPLALNVLSLFHWITPLSQQLLQRAAVPTGPPPEDLRIDFAGWPSAAVATLLERGWSQMVRATFLPSAWWLRMHHGLSATQPLFWYRWVRHPLHILGWVGHLLRGKRASVLSRAR
jgi:hypothetical protein